MHSPWLVPAASFASILVVTVVACSSSPSPATGGTDAGGRDSGSSSGGGSGSSSGGGSGSSSGSSSGGGTDASSSADAGFTCASAPECPTSSPVCCATIPLTGGTVPNCTSSPFTAVCSSAAACPTNLGSGCSGTQTVWLCSTTADCAANTNYNQCCTFGQDAGAISFCATSFIASVGGGTCQ